MTHAKTRRLPRTGAKRWAAALVLLVASGPCRAAEPPDTDREDHLRAAYLLNFAKFVEWPALGATDVLTVCFVGGTGIRESFAIGAGGKLVGNHPFVTRALTGRESTGGCQVLYVEAAAPYSGEYMGVAVSPALLTVGDAHDFIRKGGTVELFADSNRLRFNINLDNARRAGLRISSSLLQLASRVEGTGQ